MNVFHIRYRNTQGTLMRILNAASRRGLDIPYVQAEPVEHMHQITLLLEVNPKQVGQLCRDWNAIVDVIHVRAGAPLKDAHEQTPVWAAIPHPPTRISDDTRANAAMA
jgi:acetolactate synthase small subunit